MYRLLPASARLPAEADKHLHAHDYTGSQWWFRGPSCTAKVRIAYEKIGARDEDTKTNLTSVLEHADRAGAIGREACEQALGKASRDLARGMAPESALRLE